MGANRNNNVQRARSLRANQNEAEQRMWSRLRNRRLFGFKFVRQEQIGPFYADFACREANLVIELDGSQHVDAQDYDMRRTKAIEASGYRVMRFWSSDALRHTDDVVRLIADELAASKTARFEGRETRQ